MPADVLIHLHQGPESRTVDHMEEVYLTYLPSVGDTLRILLPGDRKTTDFTVTEVRHEFTMGIGRSYRQMQVEVIAYKKEI